MASWWPFGRKRAEDKPFDDTIVSQSLRRGRRMYAGAGYGRTLADWIASSTSQDAEARIAIRTLRNRSRQLARDNDYVVNALRIIQNNVIGSGVAMQCQIRGSRGPGAGELAKATNQAVEQEWAKWTRADSCHAAGKMNFSEIERLLIRTVATDGEVFVRLVTQRMGRSKVPFALEILEADYLDENYNATGKGGNEIRMGVEVDGWQRPVAYHFFTRHPGELMYGGTEGVAQRRVRVPADEVIHLFRAERPHQTRGTPWFTSALLRLRHMSGYEEAEVIAARSSACQMGFITTPDPEFEPTSEDELFDGERVDEFLPGRITTLAPGEQFQGFSPNRPSGLLDPFMRYMLRGVSAGVGVSYESLSKDYSQSNYSSSRLALLDDRDTWKELQKWIIAMFHQRVHEKWFDMATLSGTVSITGYETNPDAYNCPRWIPRGWSWIDPSKEIAAYKTAVRSGFMTQTDVVAAAGGDFDELLATRERELEAAEKVKLVFDTDPNLVDGVGAAQANDPLDPPESNPDPATDPTTTPADPAAVTPKKKKPAPKK